MKSVLKVVFSLIALGLAFSGPIARAQDQAPQKGKGGRMNPEQMVTRLDEAVKLTAEQKTKALEIYTKMGEKMQGVAREDRQTKGAEIRKETNDAIKAILTPEQQTKFDAMPQGRGGKGAPGGDAKKAKQE